MNPMADIATLIEEQIPRLRRYALALTRNEVTADDLVQDCLVRAIAKQHRWQEGTDIRAWLFTILHNQYVNDLRRSARHGQTVEIIDTEPAMIPFAHQGGGLGLGDLDRALTKLPDEQRAVILMVGLEGMTYETVAEIIGIPVSTVRSRLSRGRGAAQAHGHRVRSSCRRSDAAASRPTRSTRCLVV
jgi:RNA polymerase sigma-70 factor (ECF subfamily)